MKIKRTIQVIGIVLLISIWANYVTLTEQETLPSAIGTQVATTTDPMLAKINGIRKEAGLSELVEDNRLSASAESKAVDLATRGYWSHDTPEGTSFSDLIYKYSPNANAVGENLSRCHSDPVTAWVNSPSHYENMLGDWTYWGVGSASDGECEFVVNHFSR